MTHTTPRPLARWRVAAAALSFAMFAAPAVQATTATGWPESPQAWRDVLARDLDAARDLLRRHHPAGHPSLGQDSFLDWLERGHAQAMARADRVGNYASYMAVLNAYAAGFGDDHIRAQHVEDRRRFRWPGFVVGLRGGRWTVLDAAAGEALPSLGEEVLSCDGRPMDALGRERLSLIADWRVEAQRIHRAPFLFVDSGSALTPPFKACTFRGASGDRSLPLSWRDIDRVALSGHLVKGLAASRPGFGLRATGQGWWISMQDLSDDAAAVIEEARSRLEALQAAPFVVVDLRGNGGGNSRYATQLAALLFGDAHVDSRLTRQEGNCQPRWRASEDNLKTLEACRVRMKAAMGADAERTYGALADQMRRALAGGDAFAPPLSTPCRVEVGPASTPAPSRLQGRLILLTDHACFSSCLIATESFRRLGSLHVGTATNWGVPYTEVRDAPLPSGLARFTTMQAFAPALPDPLGPYLPHMRFEGDITDTAAVEQWILTVVAPQLATYR